MGTTYHGQHSGIILTSGFAAKNPVTIASDGTITSGAGYNGDAVYGANYAWTLTNLGTVDAAAPFSAGIALERGGSVVNGASGATTALIEGHQDGVSIVGSGTVDNFGTIEVAYYSGLARGVTISGTGTVTNEASGLITTFGGTGVSFGQDPGSVVNAGTIRGVSLPSGGTVANEGSGIILPTYYGLQTSSVGIVSGNIATSIANAGTIGGVFLQDGGSIVNQPGGAIDEVLAGRHGPFIPGVEVAGAPGQVDNSGTIDRIVFHASGTIINRYGGSVLGAGYRGIYVAGSGLVTNYGSVTGSIGVDLTQSNGAADTLTNGGMIVGTVGTAVSFGGGDDLLRVEPGAGFAGVVDGGGGSNLAEFPVTAGAATMTGVGAVFENFMIDIDAGATWAWTGSNTIASSSTLEIGGSLTAFGSLDNAGTVEGTLTVAGTMTNAGSVGGLLTLAGGSLLVVTPIAVFSGTVEGGGNTMELVAGFPVGTLTGLGTTFIDFATVMVDPDASWVFAGSNDLGGGSVVLAQAAGAQNAAGAVLTGSGTVVRSDAATPDTGFLNSSGAAVTDTGATGVGVYLGVRGNVTNQAGALISGYYGGVFIEGGGGFVVNSGSITGTGGGYSIGVYLGGGGSVNNYGEITALSGEGAGVGIVGSGNVMNSGTIAGSHIGVELFAGAATIVNYGRIAGTGGDGIGVYLGADGSTLTNAGQIIGRGGTAVYLAGSYDTLVMQPGASFAGAVVAAGVGDTLELAAGTGTLKGLGSKFLGFASVKIDPGASWDIQGGEGSCVNDGTALVDGTVVFDALAADRFNHGLVDILHGSAAEFGSAVGRAQTVEFADGTGTALLDRSRGFHATFLGFTEGDVIDLIGKSVDGLSYANHQLVLTDGGNLVADLHFAGQYTASEFALSPDGSGGTDVTLTGAMAAADFWKIMA